MSIDRQAFVESFLGETGDNIEIVESSILSLKQDAGNQDSFSSLMRALHTIKGSSRMLKFATVEKIAHGLETVLKGVKDGRYAVQGNLVLLALASCTYLRRCLDAVRSGGSDEIPLGALLETYAQAEANEPYSLDWLPAGGDSVAASSTGGADSSVLYAESVRIESSRIDGILELMNDLIINQFQLKKHREYFSSMEKIAGEITGLRISGDAAIRPETMALEDRLFSLISEARVRFGEHMEALERSALETQKELLSLQMLPLGLVMDQLPAMVEEASQGLGKDARLLIEGSAIALDRIVLERIKDPVIHIIRNSLDHGIELPEQRVAAGKPRSGLIHIRCMLKAGHCRIVISDDGRGFDYERIREKAVIGNVCSRDDARQLDNAALANFLFMPGFTTRDEATSLSGRGIGLDIVRAGIESVKGRISVSSEAGKGTEFTLVLPLSLATISGFFVKLGKTRYLFPSTHIQEIISYRKEAELTFANRRSLRTRGKIIPVFYLGILFGATESDETESKHILVVDYLGETVGIIVDEIVQHVSQIYKPLPKSMSSLRPVQGFVYDENFDMVYVLVVPEIIQRFRRSRNIEAKRRFSPEMSEFKRILVVDDSFSTREIEKAILSLEGYNIETAVDGIEALEILRRQHFDLVVTDLNMPRMDGATLIGNMRRDDKFASIPVLVVSSESDTDKRRELLDSGADGFILKADFDRGNLVQEVRYLLSRTAGTQG